MPRLIPTLTLSSLLLGGTAHAFEVGSPRLPMAYSERPLTLGEGLLRVDLAPPEFGLLYGGIGRLPFGRAGYPYGDTRGLRLFPDVGNATLASIGVGAGYGIMDNLEAGVILLPIYIGPDGDFGDIETYGRVTLVDDEISLGAQVAVNIPTGTNFAIGGGIPVSYRFGQGRIDAGVEVELIFDPDDFQADLDAPVAVAFQPQPELAFGFRSGILVRDFEEAAIPLGAFASYTLVENQAPFLDLVAMWMWPHFIWTGPGDSVDLDAFDITLGARFYFSVM